VERTVLEKRTVLVLTFSLENAGKLSVSDIIYRPQEESIRAMGHIEVTLTMQDATPCMLSVLQHK